MDKDKRVLKNLEEVNSIGGGGDSDNEHDYKDWVIEYQQPYQVPRQSSDDPVRDGQMIGDDGSLVIGGPKKPPLSTKAALSGLNFLQDNSQSHRNKFASSSHL